MLWHLADERTGLDEDELREFFAQGMLLTVMSAIDLLSVPDPWAQSFCPHPEKLAAVWRPPPVSRPFPRRSGTRCRHDRPGHPGHPADPGHPGDLVGTGTCRLPQPLFLTAV